MKTEATRRPCWPLVWLLVSSIAQYSYRYILQVNDPTTSSQYEATPAALSAIKYAIFLLFVTHSLFRFVHRPVLIDGRYRTLMYISGCALGIISATLFVRIAIAPGALDDTALCAVQFFPWMACVFFIPFVFGPEHDIEDTLAAFERITFWIIFPFWMVTVVLVIFGLRYPALSYPGALVRFGGILDDPNGYACLCLLLVALSVGVRRGAWKFRTASYVAMTIATLSITGYITGLVMFACLSPAWIRKARPLTTGVVLAGFLCVIVIPLRLYATNPAIADGISFLYSGKSTSAATHLAALYPDEAMLDFSSPVAALFGIGGFSENFYWRILANFGWLGLFGVVAAVGSWSYYALRSSRSNRPVGIWSVGLLVGSNGIAYLLTFPLSLLYWSITAMALRARENQ